MVKTRSGLVTKAAPAKSQKKTFSSGSDSDRDSDRDTDAVFRYPKCTKKGQHGRCATCARAGFTRDGLVAYMKANPRRAMPSAPVRRSAPPHEKLISLGIILQSDV